MVKLQQVIYNFEKYQLLHLLLHTIYSIIKYIILTYKSSIVSISNNLYGLNINIKYKLTKFIYCNNNFLNTCQNDFFFNNELLSYLLTLSKYSLARFGSGRIVGLFGFQFIGQTEINKIVF